MPKELTPDAVDARLNAFLRGELTGAALEAFERELDASPGLLGKVAQRADALRTTMAASVETFAASTVSDGDAGPGAPRVVLGSKLGEGGMAHVFSGTQAHLGREVAVKMVRDDAEPWVRAKLLQEARLTGSLEHPAIVPVHDVLTDAEGRLQVVLKRIEGVPWLELIRQPAEVRARFDLDPLDWHVSVTIGLCRAVGFAHERGVLHRDIKPVNVMVGRFGEVYLLDWGVAGTMAPDPHGLLPCVRELPFAGTLTCMAPEQFLVRVDELGPWTDTYLLGGCLYLALYGLPPYPTETVEERRAKPAAPPKFPRLPDVAPELVGIVRRALSAEKSDRYLTADELRRDLEAYLKHRDGRRLTERGASQLREAHQCWERSDRASADRALNEAEFGCRAALEMWPDDPVARRLRHELGVVRVRFALQRGEVQVAARLLEGLAPAPAELAAQVAAAADAEARERERLASIERDVDRRFGLRARRVLLAGFGVAWLGFWCWVAAAMPDSARPLTWFLLGYVLCGFAVVLPQRKVMLSQRLNREMVLLNFALAAASLVLAAAAPALGLSVPTLLVVLMLVWSLSMGALATIIEPASSVPAGVWLLGFGVSALWPGAVRPMLALGTLVHVLVPLWVSLRLRNPPKS